MDLLTPSSGLFIWAVIIFVGLFILLSKVAWKPMLGAIKEREASIEKALSTAEDAKKELEGLKAENEALLQEARIERDKMLKDAQQAANKINEKARSNAEASAKTILENAQAEIEHQKQAALTEVKNEVAKLSIQVAEKLIRKNLSDNKSQIALVEDFVKDLNNN